MAEISFPFSADSAGGGQQMINQNQWQRISRMQGQDHIDYQLTAASLASNTLPFYATVVNNTTVRIKAGDAKVGGFYYQLTADQTVTIASNTGTTARIDLIVLRADLSAGSVNLKVKQGQPAATPVAPGLTRTPGGIWEMPLHQVTVPEKSGTLSTINVGPFDMAAPVAVPWNVPTAGPLQPVGTFVYDMDNNNTGGQNEYFVGQDAFVLTRSLGRSLKYTPNTFNGNYTLPAENRFGRWRRIAPNTVLFSMTFIMYEDRGITASGSNWYIGATLPYPANNEVRQVLSGFVQNPGANGGAPNAMSVTAHTQPGSNNLTLWRPSYTNVAAGLDGLKSIPAGATLYISGTYETNELGL
ncbi:hypothetical protein ABZ916_25750 [Streptomyces sp. NPDC046853]|uniref:hypothetical protein n=1 Tax=Streptomyces sp. NPDC046853 TaxID=3154920 RepID=UPI0033FBE476